MITPNDLDVLIHCYVSPEVHPRIHAPAVKDTIRWFLQEDIIEAGDKLNVYTTTDKGVAWLKEILEVPMPVKRWVIPER